MHLALFQPEIPPNTGNVARSCVGMDATLHIIGPCRFDFSDAALRRAGLDYWPHLRLVSHPEPKDFETWLGEREPWLITKTGALRYDEPTYAVDDILVLGNESRGLPVAWRLKWPNRQVRIPILGEIRSYNLASSAAIVLSHACLASGRFDAETLPSGP